MNTLHTINPYSDEKLQFNKETGRYELTLAYVKDNFVVNFQDDGELLRRIRKNTRKIYNYILYRCYTTNKPIVDFCLKRTEEGRQFLLDILSEEIEADLETGYNDLSSAPAVNLSNGQVLPRSQLQANQITIDTEQIIDRNSQYFGFNILVQTALPSAYSMFVYQNNRN